MTEPTGDGIDEHLTFQERLQRISRLWAAIWSATEFCRLIGACVFFLGPLYVLVTWLFNFLQQTFDPQRYPDVLKEWSFYVLLIAAFMAISYSVWLLAGLLQNHILRRFRNI